MKLFEVPKYEAALEHEGAPSFPSLFRHNLGERHPGKLPYFFPFALQKVPFFFFADASILVRGNKSVPGSVRPTSYSLLFTNFADI